MTAPKEWLDEVAEADVVDPLGRVTRTERTALLASNVLLYLAVHAGLVPDQIDAFGITAREFNGSALLFVLRLVIAYFAVAFGVYAAADLKAWSARLESLQEKRRIEFDRAYPFYAERLVEAVLKHRHVPVDEREAKKQELHKEFGESRDTYIASTWRRYVQAYTWRAAFDVGLPFVVTMVNLVLCRNAAG